MFKTFFENILYISYIIIITYLGFNKFSSTYIIDITPTLHNSLMVYFNNTINFIEFYSTNVSFSSNTYQIFNVLTIYISTYTLQLSLIIITFGIIITNLLNSLFFSNKIYTLYNFLLNLY